MVIQDHLHRDVTIPGIPGKVISLVPSQTELLTYLKLEDSIAGITKFCVHPPHLKKDKKIVGGTKNVKIDKIKYLEPDLILCNKEENTEEIVLELEKIAPVHVSNILNLKDAFRLISEYGEIFQKNSEAESLVEKLGEEKQDLKQHLKTSGLRVAYVIWQNPWMVAGKNTFINDLLELNGWVNVVEDQVSRYPQMKINELKSLQPDIILLSSEPYPFLEKHVEELQESFKNAKVLWANGEYFSWYGSRLLLAFKYFKEFQMKLSISL